MEAEDVFLECSSLPGYVFVGQEFELHVTARRGRSLHRCNHRLAITCISSQSNKTLETRIDTVTATLHDGVCCVTLSVLEGAILESNGQPSICYLQVVAVNEDTDLQLTGKTNHFVPVKHKIVIAEDRSERYEFYKDIGGKDKGIELTVSLADARNTIVTSRSLAITPVLLYEDGSVVADQTILQTSDDVSAMHLPEGILTTPCLKFRIAQVSSKHGGRAFCIRMQPNLLLSPHAADVMPGLSVPVEVKSKIKRPASQSVMAERNSEAQLLKKIRQSNRTETLRSDDGLFTSSLLSPAGIAEFSCSVLSLQAWCTDVFSMLENKIRWKPLGYNVVEGQREKTLLYDIHNPNEHIQRLLHTYSEQVVHAIQHLVYVQKLLQTDGSDAGREEGDGSGYGPTHTQMARRTEGDMMYMESHLHLNHPDLPHEVIHALRGMRDHHHIHSHHSQPHSLPHTPSTSSEPHQPSSSSR